MPSNVLDHPHTPGILITDVEWAGLGETEQAIETSLLSGDPQVAVAYGRDLVRQGFMKGLKLAKFLFEFKEGWADTKGQVKGTDQRVEDFVFFEMGVPVETFTKYTDAYGEVLLRSPEKYRRMIAGKPIGGLILLIAAAREGQLEEGDWKDIAFSHDKASIQEVVRRDFYSLASRWQPGCVAKRYWRSLWVPSKKPSKRSGHGGNRKHH